MHDVSLRQSLRPPQAHTCVQLLHCLAQVDLQRHVSQVGHNHGGESNACTAEPTYEQVTGIRWWPRAAGIHAQSSSCVLA